MNNHNLVGDYVESKITQCALEDRKHPHSFALGSLTAQMAAILTKLEMYHPDAYNSVVDDLMVERKEYI
jgi:hypothetical protein